MKNNQSGQSTIEFIFSFIFAVSLIFLVFNTSLNYASGYVAHYATFMASRVFMTQDRSDNAWGPGERDTPLFEARKTFEKYQLGILGIKTEIEFNDSLSVSAGEYLMVGAYARYEKKMDVVGQIVGETKLSLISESFLGREPSRGVCASRVCYAITDKSECVSQMDITLFDDGC